MSKKNKSELGSGLAENARREVNYRRRRRNLDDAMASMMKGKKPKSRKPFDAMKDND